MISAGAVRPWLAPLGTAAVVLSFVLAWTYHAGRAQGVSDERTRVTDSVRTVLKDSARAIEQRLAQRAPVILKADSSAALARAKHDAIVKRIVPVTDSTVSIDGAAPVTEVPASLVIPELHTCNQAITADTVDTNLIRAQLADALQDAAAQRARAEVDEANTVKVPRFGFKSGVGAGIATVLVVLHFLK